LFDQFVQTTFHVQAPFPTTINAISFFIAYMYGTGLAPSTITTYASAIGYINRLYGATDPAQSFIIKKLLAAVRRGRFRSDTRLPITPLILQQIVASLPYTAPSHYQHHMLKAMYLLAFHTFLRIGEIALNKSPHILHLSDIQLFQNSTTCPCQLEITFRSFKGNYKVRPIML